MGELEVSFVMPACDEELSIEESLLSLDSIVKNSNLSYEVIVVDDGSVDSTLMKAINYASKNRHIRVLSYAVNEGKGFAVKKGFAQAEGDVVVFVDSDLEIKLHKISECVELLKYGDIAIASKYHPESNVDVPSIRRFLSYGFHFLVRLLTGLKIRDTQTGLKAVRRSALKNIFQIMSVKRYAFDVELLSIAQLMGLKVIEMPVNLKIRKGFKPKEALMMLKDLLGIAYRLRIRRSYQRLLR